MPTPARFRRGASSVADDAALLDDRVAAPAPNGRAMRADRFVDGNGRTSRARASGPGAACAMISARIATAISAGETAPMSRPIGAWMRAMSACVEAGCQQPLDPLGMVFLRAERADIEALALERGLQRRIVDLRIMGQRRERRVAVERRAAAARPPAIPRAAAHPGKRSGVAKAVRGSMIVTSKPAPRAIGASAWLICTAPITTSRRAAHGR